MMADPNVGDQCRVGEVHEVSSKLGWLLIAVGWARAASRADDDRRQRAGPRPLGDRRQIDRRCAT